MDDRRPLDPKKYTPIMLLGGAAGEARRSRAYGGRTNIENDLPDFAAAMEEVAKAKAAERKAREAERRRAELERGQKFLTATLQNKGYFKNKQNILAKRHTEADGERLDKAMMWWALKEDINTQPSEEAQDASYSQFKGEE